MALNNGLGAPLSGIGSLGVLATEGLASVSGGSLLSPTQIGSDGEALRENVSGIPQNLAASLGVTKRQNDFFLDALGRFNYDLGGVAAHLAEKKAHSPAAKTLLGDAEVIHRDLGMVIESGQPIGQNSLIANVLAVETDFERQAEVIAVQEPTPEPVHETSPPPPPPHESANNDSGESFFAGGLSLLGGMVAARAVAPVARAAVSVATGGFAKTTAGKPAATAAHAKTVVAAATGKTIPKKGPGGPAA